MTDWKIAMLCLLPLMADPAKMRTWGALMGASLAAMFAPFLAAFVVIDLIAGAIVLRHPRGCAQRMIGLLFAGMVFFELGFLISDGNQRDLLMTSLVALGWAQWAMLATWGAYDAAGYCIRRLGFARRSLVAERRDG